MSDIREKIMELNYDPHSTIGVTKALHKAADIAEAEVTRLEERVRELEMQIRFIKGTNSRPGLAEMAKAAHEKEWGGE